MPKKLTLSEVLDKFHEVHGDIYDYSLVDYKNSTTKIEIICSIHGSFLQTPASHIHQKAGCQQCAAKEIGLKNRSYPKEFINECLLKHNNFYSYEKTVYISSNLPIIVTCPIHGDFTQIASNHLHHGKGCSKCRNDRNATIFATTDENFIQKAQLVHNNRFDYTNTKYANNRKGVNITCREHGEFIQNAASHLKGNIGCKKCSAKGVSVSEGKLVEFIKDIVTCDVVTNTKKIISPYELDIVIPSKNIAFEFNGTYWHSEMNGKEKYYHREKTDACNNIGIKLIHINEYEYKNSDLVHSRISTLLHANNVIKIGARKMNIRKPSKIETRKFLQETHIQGYCASSIEYGLYLGDKLYAIMTFGRSRYSKKHEYELLRYSSAKYCVVQGGASKLFHSFLKDYNPKSIISYSDIRWNTGGLYNNLGFHEIRKSDPNYYYFSLKDTSVVFSRLKFQKHKLSNILENFDDRLTEWENMKIHGYDRIWDCGNLVFEWLQSSNTTDIVEK